MTTLNPSDKSSDITLSGGDLIATDTAGSGFANVRSTTSKTSGKHYLEATWATAAGNNGIGVANASASLTAYLGSDANSKGWYDTGFGHPASTTFAPGDVTGLALDCSAGKIWFAKNGVWNGDPAAGTGGVSISLAAYYATLSFQYGTNARGTINFGGSAFTYSPPSGFSAWDAAAGTPVGMAAETDAVVTRPAVSIRATGRSDEVDVAFALGCASPAGRANEVVTALALAGVHIRAVGLSAEADAALFLSARSIRAVGRSDEIDTALPLSAGAAGQVGRGDESDTASALLAVQRRAVGIAVEVDAAIALSSGQNGTVGVAIEADAALSLAGVQRRTVGRSDEIGAALALIRTIVLPTGRATETDVSLARPAVQMTGVKMATEIDIALARSGNQGGLYVGAMSEAQLFVGTLGPEDLYVGAERFF